jgi:hypothetical protein
MQKPFTIPRAALYDIPATKSAASNGCVSVVKAAGSGVLPLAASTPEPVRTLGERADGTTGSATRFKAATGAATTEDTSSGRFFEPFTLLGAGFEAANTQAQQYSVFKSQSGSKMQHKLDKRCSSSSSSGFTGTRARDERRAAASTASLIRLVDTTRH